MIETLQLMGEQHNRAVKQWQMLVCQHVGRVLRGLGMTADEVARYQETVAGIESRFARVMARRGKPVRLAR